MIVSTKRKRCSELPDDVDLTKKSNVAPSIGKIFHESFIAEYKRRKFRRTENHC